MIATLVFSAGTSVQAQDYVGSEVVSETADPSDKPFGFAEGQFRAAPVPFRNAALGLGLGVIGGYLFRADEASDTSYIGLGGFYTENDSRGGALGFSTSLHENTWKIQALVAQADLKYDLAFGDAKIPLRQEFPMAALGLQYAVVPDTFIGTRLAYSEPTFSSSGSVPLPPDISRDSSINLANLEFTFDRNRLDDSDYPTEGAGAFASLGTGRILNGPKRDFQKAYASLTYFTPVTGGVFAAEVTLCGASDSTPFFLLCSIGGTDNLRGFSSTESLGSSLISAQGEYRGQLNKWLGYVAFAGAGHVGNSLSSAFSEIAYSAGAGVRFRLSQDFKLDFSIDAAVNNFEESQILIYVGQRF